jgi:hypothetical protein
MAPGKRGIAQRRTKDFTPCRPYGQSQSHISTGLTQFGQKRGQILTKEVAPFLQVVVFLTDITPIAAQEILPHWFIEAKLICEISRSRL